MEAVTNINEIIGKKLSMEVATDETMLNIEIINENKVKYQFVGEDGTKDDEVITDLEVKFDDIDNVYDYSFHDGIATRFFLFMFE